MSATATDSALPGHGFGRRRRLPILLQTEAAECGLASVAMVAHQTLIGDMGSILSGGQKQRVLLARALYRQPRFLALDEATSHLDLANERGDNTTWIVLAHRPETLIAVDRALELRWLEIKPTACGLLCAHTAVG